MRPTKLLPLALLSLAFLPLKAQQQPHNVIIFVADGLRRNSVNATDAPTLLKLRTTGVDFANSHSVYPTFTTANASAIATGHGLGDTGDYANAFYPGVWLTRPDSAANPGTRSRAGTGASDFHSWHAAPQLPAQLCPRFQPDDPCSSTGSGRVVG